jgi:hypothetical protein
MNSELDKLLATLAHEERKRVFHPDPFFPQRVMARLKEEAAGEPVVWDFIASATRPIFALGITLLLAFLTLEALVPLEPTRGMIEAFLSADQSAADAALYLDTDAPDRYELEQLLIVLEETD